MKKNTSLVLTLFIGAILWMIPEPSGMNPIAWHLFAIFVATIFGIIAKPFPMGVIAIFALGAAVLTQTLTLHQALIGFSNEIVWLVVFAFFISRGFIITGLGNRIAYTIMSLFGKHSLGIGYGLVLTDLILAPTIPSSTARIGGVIYPILKSVVDLFTGKSHDPKLGIFLTQSTFQGSMITSAMFLTSMAGNPFIAELAKNQGITITWFGWMIAALVPGVLSLLLVPYLLFRLSKPTLRQTPHAREMAQDKLKQLGSMGHKEWVMLGSFILLIILWILGPYFEMKATSAALIGLSILLLTQIIQWKDVLEETAAWDTFIWFSILITFASALNQLGFTTWFSDTIVFYVKGFHWMWGFTALSLVYFYSHYFFVSCAAHIGAMYSCFLIISLALGTPPLLAAMVLGFLSNLMGCLTHYGTGQAPILFAMGTMTTALWWKIGFITSLILIVIWMGIGSLWWKIIGLF